MIIADQSATNQNDWVEYQYQLRDNTNEICERIRTEAERLFYFVLEEQKEYFEGNRYVLSKKELNEILDQIKKEGEEKCVKTIQTIE